MKWLTLLFLTTAPGGHPYVESAWPVSAEDCASGPAWQNPYSDDRHMTICVHQAIWVVRPRVYRLVGNQIILRLPGGGAHRLTSRPRDPSVAAEQQRRAYP